MRTELSAYEVWLNLASTSVATAFLSQYIEDMDGDLDGCDVISCSAAHPIMRANYPPSCNAMHKCDTHTTLLNKWILQK